MLKIYLTLLSLVVMSPGVAPGQGSNPFSGTWKANLAKSQRHENHLFESLTMRFEVSDDTVLLTYAGVNMGGKQESNTTKLRPDGKEYPVAEAPGIVVVTKWVGPHILESVARKDGKVLGQSTYEVSSDGKTLTAKIKGIDASGREFEQVIVFDRQ
jgi:hypothetical protein